MLLMVILVGLVSEMSIVLLLELKVGIDGLCSMMMMLIVLCLWCSGVVSVGLLSMVVEFLCL